MIPTLQLARSGAVGTPVPVTDPYFASVRLLLHCDGVDGTTTFIDSSPVAASVTPAGNAQIDTAQFKWGGASMLLDGTGDYLTTPSSSDYGLGSGDYTVEGWLRQAAPGSTDRAIFDTRAGGAGIAIYSSAAGANQSNRLILANNSAVIAGSNSAQFPINSWAHWAVCRSGATVRGFLGGAQVWSVTDSRTLAASTSCFVGASSSATQGFAGHLDDVRLTIGVARYTVGFTPPDAAFPNA